MNAKETETTVNEKVVVAVVEPLVPVTVMVVVPKVAVGLAVNDADTLQSGVHVGGLGVKTTLTPVGRVERLKVIGAATPAVNVAERVSLAEAPP